MRKSLTQLVAAAGLLAIASAPTSYAQPDYSKCKAEVEMIVRKVREIEKDRGITNVIGARTWVELLGETPEEEQLCIVRGFTAETNGDYKIYRISRPGYFYLEFVRFKAKSSI